MALSKDEKLRLLNGGVRVVCRSFVEYLAESAAPYDLDEHPETSQLLEELMQEQRDAADRLVDLTQSFHENPDLTVSFSPRFTFYNYLSTAFALQTLEKELEKQVGIARSLVEQAEGDEQITPVLEADVLHLTERQLERVRAHREALAAGGPAQAPASTAEPATEGAH